jgi:ubiquinone/menaquinone biosynthesis C-methylase UbiE
VTSDRSSGYVHGYTRTEQDRLVMQARVLAPRTYARVRYDEGATSLLEVGSGVGAQTLELRARFPGLTVTCVDREPSQLDRAASLLAADVAKGSVKLVQGDATALPFGAEEFDGAFVCWLLEHVERPTDVLRDIRRVLRRGGRVWCTEVFNSAAVIRPHAPALVAWWSALGEAQVRLGGDPNLGVRLPALLAEAGFRAIELEPVVFLMDRRWRPEENGGVTRAEFFRYWHDLFLSAAPVLAAQRMMPRASREELAAEFEALFADPDAVFYAQAMQATARA